MSGTEKACPATFVPSYAMCGTNTAYPVPSTSFVVFSAGIAPERFPGMRYAERRAQGWSSLYCRSYAISLRACSAVPGTERAYAGPWTRRVRWGASSLAEGEEDPGERGAGGGGD
eukprot:409184-Rhodomonas_salina.1